MRGDGGREGSPSAESPGAFRTRSTSVGAVGRKSPSASQGRGAKPVGGRRGRASLVPGRWSPWQLGCLAVLITLFFRAQLPSLGGERRSSLAPFEIFINFPGDASHERLASLSHNLAGPTRWAVTGPNEAWRQRGLRQPARFPWDTEQRSLQSVPSEQMETWDPAHAKAGRALAPPLSHAFPLARLPNARRCPAPVCGRGGRAASRFLLTEL